MNNFEEYMDSVYSQLTDNATDEYKNEYITYTYPMDTVNVNLPYFRHCMEKNLSPYKALLFFHDFLYDNEFQL